MADATVATLESCNPNSNAPFEAIFADWAKDNRVFPKGYIPSINSHFEHGQWWVTDVESGAAWAVHDAQDEIGNEYFDFEQISEGDFD